LIHEDFCLGKVLQILVTGDHIDWECRTFKIMSPSFESFKNHKELLVMHVIFEFQSRENVWEWNAIGCNSPFGVVIKRTAVSA